MENGTARSDLKIREYGLSHASLESVFLAVSKKYEFTFNEGEGEEDGDSENLPVLSDKNNNNKHELQNKAKHTPEKKTRSYQFKVCCSIGCDCMIIFFFCFVKF